MLVNKNMYVHMYCTWSDLRAQDGIYVCIYTAKKIFFFIFIFQLSFQGTLLHMYSRLFLEFIGIISNVIIIVHLKSM